MSQPNEPRKTSVDQIEEDAWKWWDGLDDVHPYVVEAYRKEHKITDEMVEW